MLYTVKYKQEKYKVTLKNKVKIELIKFLLLIKRIVRRGRLLIPHNLKMYILLTICWGLYGILIYFSGKIYNFPKIYTIYDTIWELKNSYFTSIILALFIGGYTQIENYKEKMSAQHEFYTDALFCFNKLFFPILRNEVLHYSAFYNDICLKDTLNHISTRKIGPFSEKELNDIAEDLFIQLDKIEDARKNNRIVGMHKERLRDYIDQAKKMLKKYNKKMSIKDISEIAYPLYFIIADLRRPWRWDINNNIKILNYLNENPENGIEQDFYYKMHLNGHKFPNNSD